MSKAVILPLSVRRNAWRGMCSALTQSKCMQEPSNPKDDAAYFESLSFFVSKVRGEHFSWEQARDMTFKDIAKNVEMYHAMLSRLFEQGAENPESAAHAELVELLALKVSCVCLSC